ncbi:MAG: YebC/PmpR family DNA-binding transcriptional regulator [Alphaproteobacteria bacterium]
MSGHSQFKNIMFRKGAQDKRKAKVFSKLAREITVAAKAGIPEPDKNPRLRAAIQAARQQNMPRDNIERAIAKADPSQGSEDYQEVRYEGYGPGNVAVIVEALTDNRNRTASVVRSTFGKFGGNLGESNSVAFNFERIGYISYPKEVASAEAMFEAALEAGANDVISDDDDGHEIMTSPDDLNNVRDALEKQFGSPSAARLDWKPNVTAPLDEEQARKFFNFLEVLEDDDDVQRVCANYDISDEILKIIEG